MRPTGLHHLSKRKRALDPLDPYPHPEKWKNILDQLLYIVSVVMPLLILPQVYIIFVHRNVAGVSIPTWSLLGLFSIPWFVYGVVHRDKHIMINYALFIVLDFAVVAGVLLYS